MDSDPNRYEELYAPLRGKPSGAKPGQMVARCPHPEHEDRHESFHYNTSEDMGGVYDCKACEFSGGGFDYAQYFNLPNPERYYNNNNGRGGNLLQQKSQGIMVPVDVQKIVSDARSYLLDHKDLIVPFWDIEIVKNFYVGFNRKTNRFIYPRRKGGKTYGYMEGKHFQNPKGLKCGVFPSPDIIAKFDRSKPLIIAEGQPDCVTSNSNARQSFCFTGGANSIPRLEDGSYDLQWLSEWKIIIIVYDKDSAGEKGAMKLKDKLMKIMKEGSEIHVAKWHSDLPKGWDISDSFKDNGNGLYFYEAIENAEIFKVCASGTSAERQEHDNENKYEGFEIMDLTEFQAAEFEPQFALIENLMDKSTISVFAGDEGCGKSWAILSAGLSLASGVPLFDFFNIQQGYDDEGDDSDE